MTDYIQRNRVGIVLACVFCLLIGCATAIIVGRTAPTTPYWIIFGGNTDPNDDDGQGAREQLIAGGWTTPENSVQVHWAAAIEQGTSRITDEAMAEAHKEYDAHCGNGQCIIAGFSLGNSPALQLAAEVGLAPENTYLFGAPQPAPGVFHNAYLDNPLVEGWFTTFSALKTDRPVAAGVQNFYGIADPYANAAPQCSGPGLFGLNLQDHRIVTKAEADGSNIWTGPDGVVNHEVGQPGVVVSGSAPSPLWAGCPPGGWYSPSSSPVNAGPAPAVAGGPNTEAPKDGPELPAQLPIQPPSGITPPTP